MSWFAKIWNLCRKEFLVIFKDPANRLILFVPIVMQSVLFGFAANYDLTHAPYVLIDQSHTQASRELVRHLDSTGIFYRVASLDNATQAGTWIDEQKAMVIVSIPADFAQNLAQGRTTPVQLILDARNSTTANAAAAAMQNIVTRFNTDWRVAHGGSATPLLNVVTRAWYNPNLQSRWNIMPALVATLSMLQIILLTALSVAREREQGTFDQLLVTPYRPIDIMIGKSIPPVLIGLVQATLVLLVVRFVFGIPFAGSLLTLYIGVLLFMMAAVGFGLMISAFSLNMQQAMLYAFTLLMPMILLSGLMTPVSNMPHMLQMMTMANPVRFAIDWVRRVYLEGASLMSLANDALPLILICTVTLPLASWLFRNRLT